MGHQFAEITFTPEVKTVQVEQRSRANYEGREQGEKFNHVLGKPEAEFIQARDSFYMASVSETGWPYVQHRGGPVGFMRVLDEQTIGFADFSGNRQYISTGNFRKNDRVALIFMDYPNRTRLKVLGRVKTIPVDDWETLTKLEVSDYRARIERGFLIHVDAFDWNCPQHITPRYTEIDIKEIIAPLKKENQELRKLSGTQSEDGSDENIELGDGPLELTITGIRQLSPRVRGYELRNPEGMELPSVEAGAHINIPVKLENGEIAKKTYSICSNPVRRDVYEIAVQREETGTGGSMAIHSLFKLGDKLRCEYPENHFQLRDNMNPAVLIAAGIGITPIKPMAQALKGKNNHLEIHYAGRSLNDMPFRDRLEWEFGTQLYTYSSNDNNRMNISDIIEKALPNTQFYICGPDRLIREAIQIAENSGIMLDRINYERFKVAENPDDKPLGVVLNKSNIEIQVPANKSILNALLNAGIDVPYSCKTGECKTCAVRVIDGIPDHRDNSLTEFEKDEDKMMCPCVSRAQTRNLVLDI